ncbi:sensor histidine kinase [Ideonella sp. BN130291]|uniref:sensor histidine kinase n=1 Tax=Ideonella sp. BN130291 TaxID=3112940 RepID=UPI002E273898|nr:ATP-binding protein [Ideonella sp. BN130291]
MSAELAPAPVAAPPRPPRWRRALPWVALVPLLLVAQSLLVWLTANYESTRAQERVEAVAAEAASEVKRDVAHNVQALQALQWQAPTPEQWHAEAARLVGTRHVLLRLERRSPAMALLDAVDSPFRPPLFVHLPRPSMEVEAELACSAARRSAAATFSRSYFVPQPGGLGLEVMDVCIPVQGGGRDQGFVLGTFSLAGLLDGAATAEQARSHELSFVEGDGTRLARAGMPRGAGVYHAERVVDLPGFTLQLRADSAEGHPRLIPNLTTGLVMGLSFALFALVVLLLRDVRRRALAEGALAEALAFRKAMEDSLITGLRARDLQGRITYANPAFCAMVGFTPEELRQIDPPPYWPPERSGEYQERQAVRMAGGHALQAAREGFETVFMRKNGERFPVMIFEAPLVDGHGRHTGWMSAVLDVSAQRRIEELSRQQQERLQATARLATVGEMASLLSHELNQPLAAIASYASGSLNLIAEPDGQTLALLKQAVQRIAEQAERAGRVIKSVHDFVRRREQAREPIRADQLVDAVLPLVRLQARKSGSRIEIDMPQPAPRVVCDRTMLEQVLLNLTRNGIQAMDDTTPLADRVLTLRVRQTHERWVSFSVIDAGPGIAADVAARLFTPFFTTRSEGMGLGLSLCRTVVEQHGGVLDFVSPTRAGGGGTEFRFTLPAQAAASAATPRSP